MIFIVKHLNVKAEAHIILGTRIVIMVHWLDHYLVRHFWEGFELKIRTKSMQLRSQPSRVPRLH